MASVCSFVLRGFGAADGMRHPARCRKNGFVRTGLTIADLDGFLEPGELRVWDFADEV
jgi:hypothetical protein